MASKGWVAGVYGTGLQDGRWQLKGEEDRIGSQLGGVDGWVQKISHCGKERG
jgi:hypothetical protein